MNVQRVLLGGVVAGVVINISEGILNIAILGDDYAMLMERYELTEPSWAMIGYLLGAFAFGLVIAWLYAAIRPRFGPGAKTGMMAGTVVWLLGYLIPTIFVLAMGMELGMGMVAFAMVWGLVEMAVAGVAAGWMYREGDVAA